MKKSEEFIAVCARTPSQVYEEHVNEVREASTELALIEKELVKQVDDYLYKTLEPFADALIREDYGHLTLNADGMVWWVPIFRSREAYDKAGGIKESVWRQKREQDILKHWPSIKKSFHWELNLALAHVAESMSRKEQSISARREVIESFEI